MLSFTTRHHIWFGNRESWDHHSNGFPRGPNCNEGWFTWPWSGWVFWNAIPTKNCLDLLSICLLSITKDTYIYRHIIFILCIIYSIYIYKYVFRELRKPGGILDSPQIWHINRSWKRQPGSFEFPDPVQGITCMLFDTFGPWTHGILISTARIEYGESSKHNLNSDWWKQINSPRWAPTSYQVIPPISRVVTPVIYSVVRPFIVVITPLITGRGPPCRRMHFWNNPLQLPYQGLRPGRAEDCIQGQNLWLFQDLRIFGCLRFESGNNTCNKSTMFALNEYIIIYTFIHTHIYIYTHLYTPIQAYSVQGSLLNCEEYDMNWPSFLQIWHLYALGLGRKVLFAAGSSQKESLASRKLRKPKGSIHMILNLKLDRPKLMNLKN